MSWLDHLLVEAKPPTPPDMALEALCECLPPADALDLREERAAILEFDAGFSRVEAGRLAGLPPTARPVRCA